MRKDMDLVIYGAWGMALGAYEAVSSFCPKRRIRCFLVTELAGNRTQLAGLPVLEVEDFAAALSKEEKEKIEILIAVPEYSIPDIEKKLDEQGLYCHVPLTSGRWAEMMGYCFAAAGMYKPLKGLPVGYHRADIQVYMTRFYKDRPLKVAYDMPEWLLPVQAGAALCEERVAELLDNTGENISEKNGNYSELSVLYWIWKNRLGQEADSQKAEYCGIVHYRRILELSQDDILRLADNHVDVVLPYPMPYEPDIEAHHKRYLKDEDWQAVLQALKELQPEYAEKFSAILRQKYFYHYNILLARKEVLREYCSWLFPILERVEELSAPKGNERADRYIGYIGESLTTLYFMANREKLHIVHTGCRLLV